MPIFVELNITFYQLHYFLSAKIAFSSSSV